mmetsp:Transcript_11063/g.33941  ORF Transcript_11063/g.33941 Transcript_11063/m.33941 type:complete len:81 (-) Transcript_11063:1046-1288(-)
MAFSQRSAAGLAASALSMPKHFTIVCGGPSFVRIDCLLVKLAERKPTRGELEGKTGGTKMAELMMLVGWPEGDMKGENWV